MTLPKNSERVMGALVHRHIGRPAVVMGGAPSLPDELQSCPENAVYISAKEHGAMLRICDYIVCVDDVEQEQRGYARGAPIIAPHPWGDYRIFGAPVPNTGATALWCAWIMGCAPIIVVGCQLYTTGTYFHDPRRMVTGRNQSVDEQIKRFKKIVNMCPHGMFRVMRGPLLKLIALYRPEEQPHPIAAADVMLKACRGQLLEFHQSFPPLGAKAGDILEVHPNDANNLRTARIAKLVTSH